MQRERDELDEWIDSLATAETAAEEAYTSLRNSWPGTKPKWLRIPWHQLPSDFRGLLVSIAARAEKTKRT
jgi:hypothetical protein